MNFDLAAFPLGLFHQLRHIGFLLGWLKQRPVNMNRRCDRLGKKNGDKVRQSKVSYLFWFNLVDNVE